MNQAKVLFLGLGAAGSFSNFYIANWTKDKQLCLVGLLEFISTSVYFKFLLPLVFLLFFLKILQVKI